MFEDIIKKLRKNIDEIDKINKGVLNSPRTIKDNENFLSILKKWNSASPKYPLNRSKDYIKFLKYDNKAGGGFFLVLDGYGLIIDPGYNFLELFYENGFVPRDIDGIFISHCHDDHCIDLESIFSVIFKINKENPCEKIKIDLFVNSITYDKYSMMFEINREEIINNLKIVISNSKIQFKNKKTEKIIEFNFLNTHHKETPWCSEKNHGVGLIIEYNGRRIFYSGDSEYHDDYIPLDLEFCEILLLNIGKIGEIDPRNTKNHLGLSGVIKIIEHMARVIENQSKLTIIISEMGFEFINDRLQLIEALRNYIENEVRPEFDIKILYSEPGTIISIDNSNIITRLSLKFNDLDDYTRIKKEILDGINVLINCDPIENKIYDLNPNKYLDFGIKPGMNKRLQKHQVFLPTHQSFFNDNGDVGYKLEKVIYSIEERINDIDAIKYGFDTKKELIDELRKKYKLRKGEYITLFEYESIEKN